MKVMDKGSLENKNESLTEILSDSYRHCILISRQISSKFSCLVMESFAVEGIYIPLRRDSFKILSCLDHSFLPTLYSHFETEKFNVFLHSYGEFCGGGDLHTFRER